MIGFLFFIAVSNLAVSVFITPNARFEEKSFTMYTRLCIRAVIFLGLILILRRC